MPSSTMGSGVLGLHASWSAGWVGGNWVAGRGGSSRRRTLVVVCLLLSLTHVSHPQSTCPLSCECKWKSGKESVVCSERAAFRTIPNGLSPDTQMLDMNRNLIQELPNEVFLSAQLLNLQKIILRDCLVRSVGREAFAKLSNLMELDLSGNRLAEVPSTSFPAIPELRELKLSSNPITVLQDNLFIHLPRLIRLELSACLLRSIGIWAFRGLPALQWLRLDNNRLLTVQAESFFPLRSLHGLTVHGNPWNCSCALQPWRDWMTKNNVPFGVPPVCTSPARLQGKSWSDLSLEDFACLPRIRHTLTDADRVRRVFEGQNVTLVCQLTATPDTQVRWLNGNKGGGVVTNGSVGTTSAFVLTDSFVSMEPDEFEVRSGSRTRRRSSATTGDRSLGLRISNLTLIRASLRDAGIFTCQAENAAGFISTNFTLNVLQNKPENVTGRLLFTGALVAALLMLFVCLLLCCIIFATRRARTATRVPTEEKIELHHITDQNGEVVSTAGQNGGNSIPLLHPNHHSNSTSPNCTNHNRQNANGPILPNNTSTRRPAAGPTNYRAVPTADPDEESSFSESRIDRDDDDWELSEPEVRVRTVDQSRTVRSAGVSRTPVPNPPLQLRTQGLEANATSSNFYVNNGKGASNNGPNATLMRAEVSVGRGRRPKYLPPRPPQPRDLKFPDLINQKTTPDFSSLPRPNRNQDPRPGNSFHRRNISESQSPLLSHSYGNSFETIHEGRFVPSTCHPTSGPHPGYTWAQQRLSMPTSPTHETCSSASSYDYHAAQLAAFLEEYRSLQNELIRMSASLNEVEGLPSPTTTTALPQFVPGSGSSNSGSSLTGGSCSGGSLAHQALAGTSTALTLQQRHTQNQLKSILKNPSSNNTNNNNYMA